AFALNGIVEPVVENIEVGKVKKHPVARPDDELVGRQGPPGESYARRPVEVVPKRQRPRGAAGEAIFLHVGGAHDQMVSLGIDILRYVTDRVRQRVTG